jgi:hypothetical protein
MAQDPHRHPGMHVERSQEGGTGMPHVMNRDGPDTRFDTTRLETPVEVARFEWGTDPGREYQPAWGPCVTRCSPRGGLVLLANAQRSHADPGQRQRSPGRLGLGFPVKQLTADTLELPADI